MDTRNRGLVITLGVLLLIVLIGPALGWGMMGGGTVGWGMMGPGMMGGYAGSPSTAGGWTWGAAMMLGWLGMIAFWGALIIGVILLARWLGIGGGVRRNGASSPGGAPAQDALDILRRRYAAGEISQEEFERMRQTLTT